MTDKDCEEKRVVMDVATLGDFARIDLASIQSKSNSLDFHTLEHTFEEAAQAAAEEGDISALRAYKVLAVICSYHFNPDRSDTFTPQMILDGRRTLIPSDFLGEQLAILTEVAEQINHPLLRARVADICWYSKKGLYLMAEVAASAYISTVTSFFKKELLYQYESDFEVPTRIVDLLDRAFTIYASIGKRKNIPQSAQNTLIATYKTARDNNNLIAFYKLALLGRSYNLLGWELIASEANALATTNAKKQYAEAVKKVWYLAANAYSKIDDEVTSKRCKVNAIEQTLRMRDGVSSSMAKASWTKDAIGELRDIGGMHSEIEVLKKELQQYEENSLSELAEFSIPIELTDERQATMDEFEALEIHEMLFRLAFITQTPEKIGIHKRCLKKRDSHFLSSIFGSSYADDRGKVIAKSPSAQIGDKPSEDWFDHQSLAEMSFHYHISSEGFIRPACMTIVRCQTIDERHLEPIVTRSLFVPPGHEAIFAMGFARLIQGDIISAVHLLIPQVENSLRHVLSQSGAITAKLNKDLTQEDQSLSQIYSNRKDELERIFGVDNTYALHLLFNLKGGPMLRHEMAHGKITSGQSYHPAAVYACWFVYHLTCIPLRKNWGTHISKAIQEVSH